MAKRYYLLLIIPFFTLDSHAAIVDFNYYTSPTDNDLVNNFWNTASFNQVQTGGITGGALVPPVSGDWNNSLTFNQSLLNSTSTTHIAAIAFQFDGRSVNPIRYNTTAQLGFFPSLDWNSYGVAAIDGNNGALGLRFYGLLWGTPYAALNLEAGNWYKLEASIRNVGGSFSQIEASASVFDLGDDGLSAPEFIASTSITIGDDVLSRSGTISSQLFAEKWGGALALDHYTVSSVPVPAAAWLFGSGLLSLVGLARLRKA